MSDAKVSSGLVRLLEEIIRHAKDTPSNAPTLDYSDIRGVRMVGAGIVDSIVRLLPESFRGVWAAGLHYRTVDLRKDKE